MRCANRHIGIVRKINCTSKIGIDGTCCNVADRYIGDKWKDDNRARTSSDAIWQTATPWRNVLNVQFLGENDTVYESV